MVEPADLPVSDVSEITDQLFIASRLRARHVEHVRDLGIDLILSTIWLAPTRVLRRPPFRSMWLPMVDFPLIPLPLFLLRRGASAAVLVMAAGGQVLIYCRAGRHRSVAMAACILIARGDGRGRGDGPHRGASTRGRSARSAHRAADPCVREGLAQPPEAFDGLTLVLPRRWRICA